MVEGPAPSPAAIPSPHPRQRKVGCNWIGEPVDLWFREPVSRNSNPGLFKQYFDHYTDWAIPATWETIQPAKPMEVLHKHHVSVLLSVVVVPTAVRLHSHKPTVTAEQASTPPNLFLRPT